MTQEVDVEVLKLLIKPTVVQQTSLLQEVVKVVQKCHVCTRRPVPPLATNKAKNKRVSLALAKLQNKTKEIKRL